MKRDLLLAVLTTLYTIIIIVINHTIDRPIKIDNKYVEYKYYQDYYTNEIYQNFDDIRKKDLYIKLKYNIKSIDGKERLNTIEYMNAYKEYIYYLNNIKRNIQNLSKMSQYFFTDTLYILEKINYEKFEKDEIISVIKEIKVSTENASENLSNSFKKIEEFDKEIKEKIKKYSHKKDLQENGKIDKAVNNVMNEVLHILPLINKIKYDDEIGFENLTSSILTHVRKIGTNSDFVINSFYSSIVSVRNYLIEYENKSFNNLNVLVSLIMLFFILYIFIIKENETKIKKDDSSEYINYNVKIKQE